MNKFTQSISNVFKGGAKAFIIYPASMLCIIGLAIVTSIQIETNTFNYRHLFESLQIALIFGTVFCMTISASAKKISNSASLLYLFNLIGLIVTSGLFLFLYFAMKSISDLSAMRVFALTVISFLLFCLIASSKALKIDFNHMVFLTLKSLFIALIYYLVLILGLEFIAVAVQALLYSNMNEHIFMHIPILSSIFGFAVFLGYFPIFNKEEDDEHIEKAIDHPTFIEILLQYIIIPIIAILTVVLLSWTVKILITKQWPSFEQLCGIFTGYSLFGILTYYLISHYKSKISLLYRKIFPIATILFLAFEGYAIVVQILKFGVKLPEYYFSIIWVFAALSSILFIFVRVAKNRLTAYIAMVLIAISFLPYTGSIDVSSYSQTKRLENVLIKNNMLVNDKIIPSANVSDEDKKIIIGSAQFFFYTQDAIFPKWLNKESNNGFIDIFGFEQYDIPDTTYEQPLYLKMGDGYLNMDSYNYLIKYRYSTSGEPIVITGSKGVYTVKYYSNNKVPTASVEKDGVKIIEITENDFTTFYNNLKEKYKNTDREKVSNGADINDLVLKAEGGGIKIMLLFENLHLSTDSNYSTLDSIYLGE